MVVLISRTKEEVLWLMWTWYRTKLLYFKKSVKFPWQSMARIFLRRTAVCRGCDVQFIVGKCCTHFTVQCLCSYLFFLT